MRRILLTAFASSLLALAAPVAASAHHSHHHARRARAHHRHHAHTVTFAPAARPSTTTAPSSETPPSGGEAAGTIASYEGGVLTITLADKSTVSGKVTEMTRIDCGCPGHEGSLEGSSGPPWQQGGDGSGDYGQGGTGDDYHSYPAPEGGDGSCGTAALLPGAVVKEAELRLGGEGAVWESVELAQHS